MGGLVFSAVGALFYIFGTFPCDMIYSRCGYQYEKITDDNDDGNIYLKVIFAMHISALLWLTAASVLFGIPLCSKSCKHNFGLLIGLIICSGIAVIFGIVAVAVLADKYLDIHYLATGVLVSNDSIYTVKVAYLLPTLIIGMVMGII